MLITVSGYGGEITLGSISKEKYMYWRLKDNDEDVSQILMGWPENCEEEYPDEVMLEPFHECDDIAHVNGAEFSSAYITVTNDNGDIIWEGSPDQIAESPQGENLIASEDEFYFSETDHEFGIYCISSEKGVFTEIAVKDLNEFDPSRLRIHIEDVEGNRIISFIEYEGAEYEDTGDYSTDGKSFDFTWLSNVEE